MVSALDSLFYVSSAVILERLILQEMPSINRLMLSEQNNIFKGGLFPIRLKESFLRLRSAYVWVHNNV